MQRKNLFQLFVPLAFEMLFFMLAGMVDTLMLSSVGDAAVGAVGTANTYISIFIMMFNVVSAGMIAVMTQYIGAGRDGVAYQAKQLGVMFNAVLGIGLSLFLCFFSGKLLEIVGVAPLLMEHAKTYLQIVGSFCFLNALIPIFSSAAIATSVFIKTKLFLPSRIISRTASVIFSGSLSLHITCILGS